MSLITGSFIYQGWAEVPGEPQVDGYGATATWATWPPVNGVLTHPVLEDISSWQDFAGSYDPALSFQSYTHQPLHWIPPIVLVPAGGDSAPDDEEVPDETFAVYSPFDPLPRLPWILPDAFAGDLAGDAATGTGDAAFYSQGLVAPVHWPLLEEISSWQDLAGEAAVATDDAAFYTLPPIQAGPPHLVLVDQGSGNIKELPIPSVDPLGFYILPPIPRQLPFRVYVDVGSWQDYAGIALPMLPGLEYTAVSGRFHYTLLGADDDSDSQKASAKQHYTLRGGKMHFTGNDP